MLILMRQWREGETMLTAYAICSLVKLLLDSPLNELIPLKQNAKGALSLETSSEAQWGRKCLVWLLAPNIGYSQWLLKMMCETVHDLPCAPAPGEAGQVGISYHHRQRGSLFDWDDFSPMHLLPVQQSCLSARTFPAPAYWETPSPLSLCQPFPSSHTLRAFLLHSQGFCRAVCSGIAWSTSGILGLW